MPQNEPGNARPYLQPRQFCERPSPPEYQRGMRQQVQQEGISFSNALYEEVRTRLFSCTAFLDVEGEVKTMGDLGGRGAPPLSSANGELRFIFPEPDFSRSTGRSACSFRELSSSPPTFFFCCCCRLRYYKKTLLDMVRRILSYFLTVLTLRLRSFFCWCPSSRQSLDDAERRVLGSMGKQYSGYYVDVGRISDSPPRSSRVWTIQLEPDEEADGALPLVLVHGYLCGAALWVLNLEALSRRRRVYAIDLLGFGKSSRPALSSDAGMAEAQLAQALEGWRCQMGLERFVLLGHSFGAFVASAYTLRRPEHVAHLILEDPWGFSESRVPDNAFQLLPWLVAAFTRGLKFFSRADICTLLRAGGMLGPLFLGVVLAHETNMFRKIVQDETAVVSYFYHCNVRRPTGEASVKALMHRFPWVKHPMVTRLVALPPEVGLTFIYGAHSFMGRKPAFAIRDARTQSFVQVHVLEDCGHNLHYEKPEEFCDVVNKACELVDERLHQKID
ncbi:(Lyso)-N-acylphosphatidylethanolamine lipase-like isoform X2 [Dermacentor andersoni]|uniref:(Lyso)-N-acylphosphatidylethanolamine lipase-like isoform X2 n=2 Tax=Dermacentor andersoni TaxID=34620 RepID=UPI003B3B1FBB